MRPSTQRAKQQSRDCVLQSVRHHGRTKTFSRNAHHSEGKAEQRDEYHTRWSFVTMPEAEENAHYRQCEPAAAQQMRELPLQIAAKDELLAEARGCAESDPDHDLQRAVGRKKADLPARLVEAPAVSHAHRNRGHRNGHQCSEPNSAC